MSSLRSHIRSGLFGAALALLVAAAHEVRVQVPSVGVGPSVSPPPLVGDPAGRETLLRAYLDLEEETDRLPFLATVGFARPHPAELRPLLSRALFDESDRCRDQATLWIAAFEFQELLPELVRALWERRPARPVGPARPVHYGSGGLGMAVLARFGPGAAPAALDPLLAGLEEEGIWLFPWMAPALAEMAPADPRVRAAARRARAHDDRLVAAAGRRILAMTHGSSESGAPR